MNELRRRLFLAFFVVMLLALALPILYGRQKMHADILEDMRAATLREARVAAALLEACTDMPVSDLQQFLVQLGRGTGSRLTFISDAGQVMADSDVDANSVDELPSHLDRPEITGAAHNGYGSAIRHSSTLHLDQIYAAVAVQASPYRPAGVLRVAVPFAGIAGRVDALALGLGFCALLAALLAWGLSRFMLGRLDTAIQDMTKVVEYTAPRILTGTPRPTLPPRREFRELSLAVSDMADRVETQIRTIGAQKAELASILDTMEEGVLVLDPRGRIRRSNPALNRLFPQLLHAEGKLPMEAIPLAELQQTIDALTAEPCPLTSSFTMGYGQDRTMAVQVTRVEGCRDVGIVAVLHDVSDMVRMIRMKRDLIANVSHELRTPLTSIQGYADTLLEVDDDTQTRRKFVHIIRKHAAHMARLVEDLLTLSRLENGDGMEETALMTGKTIRDTLENALKDALDECRPQADARHILFVHELPSEIPDHIRVRGDGDRLSQVFRNLLENACKYGAPATPVFVKAEIPYAKNAEARPCLRVTVQDFGPGIPRPELERIFDRFHRVEKHRGGGTGLGLAICKHIIERLGGRIWAEYAAAPLSVEGTAVPEASVGATIRFTLPLDFSLDESCHSSMPTTGRSEKGNLT